MRTLLTLTMIALVSWFWMSQNPEAPIAVDQGERPEAFTEQEIKKGLSKKKERVRSKKVIGKKQLKKNQRKKKRRVISKKTKKVALKKNLKKKRNKKFKKKKQEEFQYRFANLPDADIYSGETDFDEEMLDVGGL